MRYNAWRMTEAEAIEERHCRMLDLEMEFNQLLSDNRPEEEWLPIFQEWERLRDS